MDKWESVFNIGISVELEVESNSGLKMMCDIGYVLILCSHSCILCTFTSPFSPTCSCTFPLYISLPVHVCSISNIELGYSIVCCLLNVPHDSKHSHQL